MTRWKWNWKTSPGPFNARKGDGMRSFPTGADRRAWKMYLCAFLLPIAAAAVICIRNGVYPFGENCILHIDMYHQYEPFFTEFLDKLQHGGSLSYSFRLGLGSDFAALFAYYLASPLNWLLALCPASHVIEFMTVLVLLKIGFCGLSFAAYLWQSRNGGRLRPAFDVSGIVFASCYALSGYMAAYSWNIMWLDCLALAPLAVLGLHYLVREGRCRLYCVSLALAVLSNYYIAFLLCVFLAFYFVILLLEEAQGKKKTAASIGRFALYSLLGGGMGCVLMLPEAIILGYSGSSGIHFPKTAEWYFDLASMLARHCFHVEVYTGRDHWPNLYCGAAALLLAALYLMNRKISRKKKLLRVALILLFWAAFSNNMLDFLWHGFHFPDSLPGRQSFLYIFLLLSMAYEAYKALEGNSFWHVVAAGASLYLFLFAAFYFAESGLTTGRSLAVTAALILGYGLILLLFQTGDRKFRLWAGRLFLTLAAFEVIVNFSLTGMSVTSRVSYTKNWDSVKGLLEEVEEREDAPFYRVEEMERLTKNDAAIYGYRSSTIFSSLMNINVSRFLRDLGMEGGKNFYSYSGATPLVSAMLSVKYLISKSPYEESPLRKLVAGDGENYIYENLHTLPLGFMVDAMFEADWNLKKGEKIWNINRMARALGAKADLLLPAQDAVEAEDEKTTVRVEEDGYFYASYTDTSVTNLTVTNGRRTRKFTKCDHGYLLDLGWCRAGDEVELTNTSGVSEFQVRPYRLNFKALETAYEALSEQTLQLDFFSDDEIRGRIAVKKPGNLILSIPKEEGWSIYVDGEETEGGVFMDSFIEIPLISGEHQIALRYHTPGLKAGAAVSLCCLAVFVFLCALNARKGRE